MKQSMVENVMVEDDLEGVIDGSIILNCSKENSL
jgi:hypothetical protein